MKTMKNSLSTPLSKRLFRPCKKFGKYVLKFLARTKISFWKGKKSLGGFENSSKPINHAN
jgi:hypothetical protein